MSIKLIYRVQEEKVRGLLSAGRKSVYEKHGSNDLLTWIILHISSEYNKMRLNNSRKFKATNYCLIFSVLTENHEQIKVEGIG